MLGIFSSAFMTATRMDGFEFARAPRLAGAAHAAASRETARPSLAVRLAKRFLHIGL
jgi:hypothetical protein